MKRIYVGLLFGAIAGMVDVVPMVLQGLSLDADLSAFLLWVVSGFLVSTTGLKMNGAFKGVLISFLALAPAAVLIGWNEPVSLVPIAVMTLVLGALLGFAVERFGK